MRNNYDLIARFVMFILMIIFIMMCTLAIKTSILQKMEEDKKEIIAVVYKCQYVPTPAPVITPSPTPIPNEQIKYYNDNFKGKLHSVSVSAIYMEFEYIGDYYITAYCPEECGYNGYNYPTGWITSTGTICHREEEWWNPSTCGINTSVNHYGDLFLIDGKVFVAEDTGPGAVGHWIDTFMPDYESMKNFGSHWTDVYSVNYVETDQRDWHYDFNDFWRLEHADY